MGCQLAQFTLESSKSKSIRVSEDRSDLKFKSHNSTSPHVALFIFFLKHNNNPMLSDVLFTDGVHDSAMRRLPHHN